MSRRQYCVRAVRTWREPAERIDQLLSERGAYWRQQPHLRLAKIVDDFAKALAAKLDLPVTWTRQLVKLKPARYSACLALGTGQPHVARLRVPGFCREGRDQLGGGVVVGREGPSHRMFEEGQRAATLASTKAAHHVATATCSGVAAVFSWR